ncbi:MAG: substrate-binding domain-containing protein [Dyella sp.]
MSFRLARLLSATLLCAGVSATVLAAGPTLIWRGDVTTARGVVESMAKAWEKAGHGKIVMQPFNTASGLDAVASGAADLAGSARGSNGGTEGNLTFTPVAWDALVLITNPSNPVSNLTLLQAHDIYFGKITNWSQVGGRDEPINVYAVVSPGDGVEYSLRRLLFGRGSQAVAAPRLYINTTQLEAGVSLDPKSLGVSTMAGIQGNSKVKAIKINGVAPSEASVANGSYVLYTPLYLVTNPNSPKAADTKAFIDFMSSAPAKSILHAHDVLPYDEGTVLVDQDSSRRAKILAEVGAHASAEPATTAPSLAARTAPSAAPGAPVANAKAEALAARKAKAEELAAARQASKGAFDDVKAVAVSTAKPSFKHVRGDAITVSDQKARGGAFSKVTSDAFVSYGKLAKAQPAAATTSASAMEKPAASPIKIAAAVKAKPAAKATASTARTYKVNPGDTLYSIAHKHDLDVAKVRAWNGMKDNTVHPGQVLRLSAR